MESGLKPYNRQRYENTTQCSAQFGLKVYRNFLREYAVTMITLRLPQVTQAIGTSAFNDVLKMAIEELPRDALPLQQGLRATNYVVDRTISAMILAVADGEHAIGAKVGIFYAGIVAGCSCADDPMPINEENEYCELQLEIDKATGATSVTLLPA